MIGVLILLACAACGVVMGAVSVAHPTLPVLVAVSAAAGVCWWLMLKLPLPVAACSVLWCLVYELSCLVAVWGSGAPPRWYNVVGGLVGLLGVALLSI